MLEKSKSGVLDFDFFAQHDMIIFMLTVKSREWYQG
jgi:hypothetical protein